MGDFEGLRAAVAAGDGVVARFPGIVVVAQGEADGEAHVRRLLDICRENAGEAPGRMLARRLATWLGGSDGPPDTLRFGTLSATGDDGLAVFCYGAVSMVAEPGDTGGQGATISGTDAAAWADRLLPRPDAPVLLTLDGAPVQPGLPASVHDLQAGIVPGAAVVLLGADARLAVAPADPAASVAQREPGSFGSGAGREGVEAPETPAESADPGTAPADSPEAADAAGSTVVPDAAAAPAAPAVPAVPTAEGTVSEAPVAPSVADGDEPTQLTPAPPLSAEPPTQFLPPPPGPDPDTQPRPPRRADTILGGPAPELRPPLEAGGAPGTPLPDDEPTSIATPPQARGHLCSRGHLNDPRSHFCVICGIRMNQQTGVLVLGPRPPLGLLVFDDGATYTVDAEYLLGRMPEVDERVSSGALRSISIEDRSGAVSRVHAEVRLNDWDVLLSDCNSRNGTHYAAPGEQAWTALRPGETHRLTPGMRVRLGGRTFVFESPSGVR
ncbi:FHA domain-containing protein [Pseudonocardia sp.]|uniref:FHA domain-containing protein n=1 Tax=Pseudonocardia sp. TaxID=60912 RepID=UPI003D10B4DB